MRNTVSASCLALALVLALPQQAEAQGYSMFGFTRTRNMVSPAKGLPSSWNLETGENVLWVATLGSQSYGGPVTFDGKVFVGSNNESHRNSKLGGDRGTMLVFHAADGKFLWQSASPKLAAGRVNDWPLQGTCSGPYVEGNRLYYVSNRAELICADTEGFRDGENDGPFTAESEKSEIDEDVVWKLDLIGELDVFPHNLAAGNPLVVDDLVYTTTGQGVDEGHINIPTPQAPSFVAANKNTGELVWESSLPGNHILHGSWSNPSYAVVRGRAQVIFPGGDGWVYSFEPKTGKLLWKFDCNPKDSKWVIGGSGTRNNIIANAVVAADHVYIGVGQDPEHGEGIGHFYAIPAWLDGDITGKEAWHRGGEDFHRTISTAAIADGLLYITDLSGFLYCLDAKTGQLHWTHDVFAAIWGSPFVVDGKVYLGDEDGDVVILEHGKTKKVLGEFNMGNSIYSTPVAQDGVLYVASRSRLFALKTGAKSKSLAEWDKKNAAAIAAQAGAKP